MSHSHLHSNISRTKEASTTSPGARRLIVFLLVLMTLLTVAGMAALWPDWEKLEESGQNHYGFSTAPGVSYERAEILQIEDECTQIPDNAFFPGETSTQCVRLTIRLLTGTDIGMTTQFESMGPAAASGLSVGSTIQVIKTPDPSQMGSNYSFTGIPRGIPIALFALIFVISVLAVAGFKGAFALLGLGFATVVIVYFMLPALASGQPGILVGLVGSTAIMLVVIHVAHGFSMRTASAMLGTFAGLVLSALLGIVAVVAGHLSGYVDETSFNLATSLPDLNMRQLLIAAILLSGLGVLNDVTITQSSAVWELRIAAPNYTRREIYNSAMRIGRDHIASTIYTIVFAYTGAALATVMLIVLFFNQPLTDLFTIESLAVEILQIFASGAALVLSVPITTAIAVAAVRGPKQLESEKDTSVLPAQ